MDRGSGCSEQYAALHRRSVSASAQRDNAVDVLASDELDVFTTVPRCRRPLLPLSSRSRSMDNTLGVPGGMESRARDNS